VSKSKGRNQEDRHNPLEKNLQNQITIDSRTFFDSFAIYQPIAVNISTRSSNKKRAAGFLLPPWIILGG
jgi:hypothetical protein